MEQIKRGEIALPDIQRPFVWSTTKVRDLFDSMYKGFPVGYLLFWKTGAEGGARQIGTHSKEAAPRLLIVDGQQRLTSLFSVMTGTPIVKSDYSEGRIKIAFRPRDGVFAVADAAVERNPEFISDICVLWETDTGYSQTKRSFLKALAAGPKGLSDEEADRLEEAIDRLRDLRNFPFKAVELEQNVDEEQVAEVFVRINSEGVTLNQADFILTLMSVFWDDGRRQLEGFCRGAVRPAASGPSPFNWFIQPSPAQLLRPAVAVAFRRAVLKHIYTLLRGRDADGAVVDEQVREQRFQQLAGAQSQVVDLTNWHEFMKCLERAGFQSGKMISSDNAVIFSYAMWLTGRVTYGASISQLRRPMARWFFMSQLTSRYSGSFESRVEQDFALLEVLGAKDAETFVAAINRIVDDTLTNDYWNITLPNDLATSAAKSPAMLSLFAAQCVLDADVLMSETAVRARLDPAVTGVKGIERHHLFPRAYLRGLGIDDLKQINQIANMALVDWVDNIEISDTAPAIYWSQQVEKAGLSEEALRKQMYWHALPEGWEQMTYDEFLPARRILLAALVRDGFKRV